MSIKLVRPQLINSNFSQLDQYVIFQFESSWVEPIGTNY